MMNRTEQNLRRRLRRLCLLCLAPPAALAGIVLFAAGCMADRVIFQPPGGTPAVPGTTMLEVAAGLSVAVLYLPPPEGGYMLLYSHGNAEDLGSVRYRIRQYAERGYGVAAYDYEGYGQSGGEPSEAAACRDIERVWRYLVEERGVPPESIVIYGRSVGSGPSCFLAEKVPARALVLEAPFKSTFSVVGMGWLPFDRFRNIDRVAKINLPLLIIHGTRDTVVPYSHGEALFEAAAGPKRLYTVEGGGHNNLLFKAGERYWETLREFLASPERKE